MTAEEVVRRLRLEPHPEGGFYREIYRAPGEGRTAVTSIYFLLEGGPSRWHRVDAPGNLGLARRGAAGAGNGESNG